MAEQKAEEIRILRELSTMVRKGPMTWKANRPFWSIWIFLSCLAHLADRMRMETPEIHEGTGIRLIQARHPLLALSFEKKGPRKQVVPLTLELGSGIHGDGYYRSQCRG